MRNPSGLCKCGCGRKTNRAPQKDDGYEQGEHFEYLRGHSRTGPIRKPVRHIVEDRGYLTPCWIWQLYINSEGYGKVKHKGRTWFAHRLSYEQARGPVPDGKQLDHLCRVTACVNPDHLEVVTNIVNSQRRPNLKFTPALVLELRERVAAGEGQSAVARELGVPTNDLTRILTGAIWPNVGGPRHTPRKYNYG